MEPLVGLGLAEEQTPTTQGLHVVTYIACEDVVVPLEVVV